MAGMKDLTGMRFGKLQVTQRAENSPGSRAARWECQCDCGNIVIVRGSRLSTGKKTDCGCVPRKATRKADIAGQRFHRLTALYETDGRAKNGGSVIWHCRCDCGREVDVSYNALAYGTMGSCGCRKEEHNRTLQNYLTHVAGTSIEAIRPARRRADNTSGVTGVSLSRGKYMAWITFQGKDFYLGRYDRLETAAMVRKEAKRELHENFLSHYGKWKARAQEDAQWADAHPIQVEVQQQNGELKATMLPRL